MSFSLLSLPGKLSISFTENIFQIRDICFENEAELRELAYLYASVPLDWDHAFQVTDVEQNYSWFLEKRSSLKCLIATFEAKIVGIHILQKQNQRPEACFIKTLWVLPCHRGKGLGSLLKNAGEVWAKKTGSTIMVTNVMVVNSKMLEINKQKGFVPTKIEMEKQL